MSDSTASMKYTAMPSSSGTQNSGTKERNMESNATMKSDST
jgi:hypothetical protein